MNASTMESPAAEPIPRFSAEVFADPYGDEPIRAELFSQEHLAAHARQLASGLIVATHRGQPLLRRFAQNSRLLVRAHRSIAEACRHEESIGTDAEWFLDNFHIIEDTLREVRIDLPRGYYAELPKIAAGPLSGFPRVYALAIELITHTDSSLDEANITQFVQAFQELTPLTIGELWAMPIMLRLGLLENLRRLARQMEENWQSRCQADDCVAYLCGGSHDDDDTPHRDGPGKSWFQRRMLALVPRVWRNPVPATLSDPLVVRLVLRLRDRGPSAESAVAWLENRLAEAGTTPPDVLRRENQRQAIDQVSVGNCVTSLRLLSALDWTLFFERTSHIEAVLREDPAGIYSRQDFATKDRYRHVIERIARGANVAELAVARRVVQLAREQAAAPQNHVGFFLIDRGKIELTTEFRFRLKLRERFLTAILNHPNAVYFGALGTVFCLILITILFYASLSEGSVWLIVVALVAALLPASELAVGVVNYVVTQVLPPRVLPRLDLKDGIPPECVTFVVMPTMLLSSDTTNALVERLEVHYLSNPDAQLRFALLTDFADAEKEETLEDDERVSEALAAIQVLNDRYGAGVERFFLFHRRRLWNPVQGRWMGWERKRGKLAEFNRLLRGARDTSFSVVSSDLSNLPYIRFCITLDADTQLPRETARRLVGVLAHPLNQARFHADLGRVVDGYTILQPRVSLDLTASTRTWFTRIFAGSAGIDPYTTAVSDVYQDLFGLGSYVGKGIYDVDAFATAVGDTFPDNHILSHDLIEGNYARCGLVTDIEWVDEFPSRYDAYARREHRWARGDWQILPWIFPSVPASATVARRASAGSASAGGASADPRSRFGLCSETTQPAAERRRNPLTAVARWKIFDNLRRSLVPPALIVLFGLGWTVLPGSLWLWTGVALATLALPLALRLAGTVLHLLRTTAWLPHLRELRGELPNTAAHMLLTTTFLPDQARLMADAAIRTVARLYITRRQLLEWESAAATEQRLGNGGIAWKMWPVWPISAVLALAVGLIRPEALPAALPFIALWLVSPAVALWVSRPRVAASPLLTPDDRRELRRIARKTWSFFETFVGDEDHWLPPDNYQEDPKGQVAHRTSPTNQGMLLLATLAAHDLGYVTLSRMLERLEKTFDTFDQLERFRGHFLNWYDTLTLRPLPPGYISTVDSGNLMGCLLTLKQGLREIADRPVLGPAVVDGLADTLRLVTDSLHDADRIGEAEAPSTSVARVREFEATIADLNRQLNTLPSDLAGWFDRLVSIEGGATTLLQHAQELGDIAGQPFEGLQRWTRCFVEQVQAVHAELRTLAPWLELLPREGAVVAESHDGEVGAGTVAGPGENGVTRWKDVRDRLTSVTSLAEFQVRAESITQELVALEGALQGQQDNSPVLELRASVVGPLVSRLMVAVRDSNAADLLRRCERLADRAEKFAMEMDFRFLYNGQRHLFAVGYNLALGRLDNCHYDLLASEARLASLLAVARGEATTKHWFQLGRPLTRAASAAVLVSWGGTMFEYLMPRLMLRNYPGTLLDTSDRAAVERQIEYGRQARVPWGISESAFNVLDVAHDYQYQSFGVPGLGLRRGLANDLVIAPYATALAAMVHPHHALKNFRRLRREGAEGPYGFYEAIDYTRDRLPAGRRCFVVRSFMAHHQGMSLVALANCLLGDPMPRRFHAEPLVRSAELLLQERVPRTVPVIQPHDDEVRGHAVSEGPQSFSRRLTTPNTPSPRTHLLSNGRYSVMVTNAGSGQSTCSGLDVTRWREDRTRDSWGQFCYVRDRRTGRVWSTGHQPVCHPADDYEVIYSVDKAEFRRVDGGIGTIWEIAVHPETNAEVRRVTLINHDRRRQRIELTSYAEIVLGSHGADLAHPAFHKLFLETEFIAEENALLCRRRPRSAEEKPVWAVHVVAADTTLPGEIQFETDRARFLGRGRTLAAPAALEREAELSGTTGPVLDPILSLRRRVRIEPGASVSVAFTTAVAESREQALALADQFHDFHAVVRTFELAWAHSQVELRHQHLSAAEAHLFQRLAGHIVYTSPTLRAAPGVLMANQQGQSALWRYAISGDKPILLVRIDDIDNLSFVRQLLSAHGYWRLQGLEVDLVILCEELSGYFEELFQQALAAARASDSHGLMDKPGGVFVRKATHLPDEDKILLQAAARVVLVAGRGSLAAQVDRQDRPALLLPRLSRAFGLAPRSATPAAARLQSPTDLLFANGLGGFRPDGREYVIYLDHKVPDGEPASTPAPWINVVANPSLGFIVSESGSGYTWAGNSQTNRLTPWNNDPVADPAGEVVYLRDEVSGDFWTPTPLPIRSAEPYLIRHGQGYTTFEHVSHGLAQELLQFVPPDDPVKLVCLKVRNETRQPRRLSATFYAEWVLGTVRDHTPATVITQVDDETGALFARSAFRPEFARSVAFADVNVRPRTLTADRTEFLGRNGSVRSPAALVRTHLSGNVGATLDPCAAIQAKFELRPGEEKQIVFVLGEAGDVTEVRRLLARYREPSQAQAALAEVRQRWDGVLGAVEVRTPNRGLDLLVNRWLVYQVLGCRLWARSAFYQSGGAYGFRDQLQDVMALVYGAPEEARAHILRAASRQFVEGDVQHWWHPPTGRGVRTRCSDDFLWLPFVVAHYVETTGDISILDERVPFLRAPTLRPDQDEDYRMPETADEKAMVYEHCTRAIEQGLRFGEHGLPLIGTGDWNDGMNRVGHEGKGESVWNGWFLLTCLRRFAELADSRGDTDRASRYREQAEKIRAAIEEHAWDGQWYRRAYFDDGTPLGSRQNDECQIDSLSQSWAVISGAAEPGRAEQAIASANERLVRRDDKLIRLLTPPFDQGHLQPGYIKGYVPGIRENGGQYTHAATWLVQATALLGRGDEAMELFELINPIKHSSSAADVKKYRVEPYVVVADIYGESPHVGRGGWTWYTGSASWLYRVALETILGFRLRGNRLSIEPCVPRDWPQFEITYRYRSATYHITVQNPHGAGRGVQSVSVDGTPQDDGAIALEDDGRRHAVQVVLGPRRAREPADSSPSEKIGSD